MLVGSFLSALITALAQLPQIVSQVNKTDLGGKAYDLVIWLGCSSLLNKPAGLLLVTCRNVGKIWCFHDS